MRSGVQYFSSPDNESEPSSGAPLVGGVVDVGVPDGLSVAEPLTPVGEGADGAAGSVVVFDGDAPGVVPGVAVGDGDEPVGDSGSGGRVAGRRIGPRGRGQGESGQGEVSDPDLVRAADPSQ